MQAHVARLRERRSNELYALSRELSQKRDIEELAEILVRHVTSAIEGQAAVLLPDAEGHLLDPTHFCTRGTPSKSEMRYPVPGNDLGIAQWAYDHRQKSGHGTDTLASADAIYFPLNALRRCIGVLGLRPKDPRQLSIPEQMHLLESFVSQAAIAMERVHLAQAAQTVDTQIASEQLRSTLLASISHDFRTPLASIIGATSTLLDDASTNLDPSRRRELLRSTLDESQRLHRLVGNLLDLTRLTSGPIELKREWVAIDEVIGAVLSRLREAIGKREIRLQIPDDLPLVRCDEVMIEQVRVQPRRERAEAHAAGFAGAHHGEGVAGGDGSHRRRQRTGTAVR